MLKDILAAIQDSGVGLGWGQICLEEELNRCLQMAWRPGRCLKWLSERMSDHLNPSELQHWGILYRSTGRCHCGLTEPGSEIRRWSGL